MPGKPCPAPYQEVGSLITFLLWKGQYIWKGRACSKLGQAWEETAWSSLQVYLERAAYTVLRASQGQRVKQQVPMKISPCNSSIIRTCTGKHSRRPTTTEMESEPTCDSISYKESYIILKENTVSALPTLFKASRHKCEAWLRVLRKVLTAHQCPLVAAGMQSSLLGPASRASSLKNILEPEP